MKKSSFILMAILSITICLSCLTTEVSAASDVKFVGDVKGSEYTTVNGKTTCEVKVREIIYDPNNTLAVGDMVRVIYNEPLGLQFNYDVEVFGKYYDDVGPPEYVGCIVCLESPYYMISTETPTNWILIIGLLAGPWFFLGMLLYYFHRREKRKKQETEEKLRRGEFVEYVDRKGVRHVGPPEEIRALREKDEHKMELERIKAGKATIVVKETVKIRCRYCGKLFDSGLDECPHCGGRP